MAIQSDNLLPPNEAKRRTARIETDYLRRRNPFETWKVRFAGLAALAAIAWIAVASVADHEQELASRGPVAYAHAMWENNCQTCHVDFIPIAGAAAGLTLTNWAHASDENCRQCHAGPSHHATDGILDASTGGHSANCATCHVEHRGRDADLRLVADRQCTNCHANLAEHVAPGTTLDNSIAHVRSFSIDAHPAFRSLARDPSRLKFNHALHMTAGLTHGKDGRQPMTLDHLSERDRRRYSPTVNNDKYIQLNCESCHEFDPVSQSPTGVGSYNAMRGSGEYYRPVVYERHCQACHPLPYQPGIADTAEAQLPHGLGAKQLESRVRDTVLATLVRQTPELQDWGLPTVPGNEPPALLTDNGRAWVELQVNQSARYLKSAVCAECHEIGESSAGESTSTSFPEIAAVEVPAVWLKRARFDHAAHRAVTCVDCHARAYSNHAEPSRSASDVLVPNIETCVRCHVPEARLGARLGARHDCVECHLYHGREGDEGLLDGRPGAPGLRRATNPRSIDELLELQND